MPFIDSYFGTGMGAGCPHPGVFQTSLQIDKLFSQSNCREAGGGYATSGVFAARVLNRLKRKKIAKTAAPKVRKHIERKEKESFE